MYMTIMMLTAGWAFLLLSQSIACRPTYCPQPGTWSTEMDGTPGRHRTNLNGMCGLNDPLCGNVSAL